MQEGSAATVWARARRTLLFPIVRLLLCEEEGEDQEGREEEEDDFQ